MKSFINFFDLIEILRELKILTRYLRATRKNDTYARPHPHQIHCAQMSCHGYFSTFVLEGF
jgi:hypothetical protein